MATRFGGVSPAHTYATKVRWLVGCLVSVIVVLAIAVVIIAQQSNATQNMPAQVPPENLPPQPVSSTVTALITVSRIEAGMTLDDHLFRAEDIEADKAPLGIVRQSEFETVRGKFAKRMIEAGAPLVRADVTEERPVSPLFIPPGYRALAIQVDERTSVDNFARPNSRVDVIWTYSQSGKQKVATVVHFCKVLSVGGVTAQEAHGKQAKAGGPTTVTLLVAERDAKKIELARSLGSISLVLVGDQEPGSTEADPDSVSIEDIIGRPAEVLEEENERYNGIMYTVDPKTGKQLRYTLRSGRWQQDKKH